MAAPLAGTTIIDFSEYIAGPYCTMMLADMGADVIKVERPHGDAWRHTAPVAPYEGRGFLGVNRGKRSIAIDLTADEGLTAARRMLAAADVTVLNYRPGVAERMGLSYDALSRENPRLIYCENTAFGREGPYGDRPGFDILSQAATGMILYENKIERGVPGYISTLAVADLTSAMFMAFAIVAALHARSASGVGQRIETSLFAAGIAAQYRPLLSIEDVDGPVREGFLSELAVRRKHGLRYQEAEKLRREYLPARGRNNYYRVYETRDGLIAVACLQNQQRRGLRDALAVDDPTVEGLRYDWFSEEVRRTHREVTAPMEAAFLERTTDQWIAVLDDADVPCGPVNFPEEIFEHPQVIAGDLMANVEHEVLGQLRMPRSPLRMDGVPASDVRPPPALGAHSREVLSQFGYSAPEIEGLMERGIVATRDTLMADDAASPEGATPA
ncbi:MAG: CoA transferase [Chloroflexota bacterium]|nr:CoA transferase [Chloroflexota bacterium]